ncbi:MAG TPA: hypothetical protein VIH42_01240, partial [Thermoguttaceae bacterium]
MSDESGRHGDPFRLRRTQDDLWTFGPNKNGIDVPLILLYRTPPFLCHAMRTGQLDLDSPGCNGLNTQITQTPHLLPSLLIHVAMLRYGHQKTMCWRRLPIAMALLHGRFAGIAIILAAFALSIGCSSNKVTLRTVPQNPLVDQLQLTSFYGPRPSGRTEQLLRLHNLKYEPKTDPRPLIKRLQAYNNYDPRADRVYAMAELAYLGGREAQKYFKTVALDLYGASVLYSYLYLFDDRYASTRNPYDPQYRGACDLYNSALESGLRIICSSKELVPGTTKTIETAAGTWDITCTLQGSRWRPQDFARFDFVSDFEVKGLKNHYLTHGLGVPLIAVRRSYKGEPAAAKYYPVDLSFPVTAFLRPLSGSDGQSAGDLSRKQGVLELYDPLTTNETMINRHLVPLESDLTTPLAYFLSKPELDALATVGLLRPEALLALRPDRPDPIMGLYMVQPYEPGKIPVILVHGLWSSPMTWMEMFNDLRSSPEIRDRYQFWFYLYPTGQPFWLSAAQLRRDLAEMRQVVDP